MGITLIDKDGVRTHSDDLKFTFTTKKFDIIPEMRLQQTDVPGRDGAVVHELGYKNGILELECALGNDYITGHLPATRRIAEALYNTKQFILDYEPNVIYTLARSISKVQGLLKFPVTTFTVIFEFKPHPVSVVDPTDEPRLATTPTIWADTKYYWTDIAGRELEFNLQAGNITLVNLGSYEIKPVIKVVGATSSITITDGENLISVIDIGSATSDTVYIDCENHLVYDAGMNNWMHKTTGGFPKLSVGDTELTIASTSTVTITFDYRDTYL